LLITGGSYGLVIRSRKVALRLAAMPVVVVCVFIVAVLVGQGLDEASLWATVLGLPVGLVAAGASVLAVVTTQIRPPVPSELEAPEWGVDRPAELEEVVSALLSSHAETVGITTGLYGAGGFGKTTLALMACADPRVRRRFKGFVYWVTVGPEVRGATAMAAKINDVIKLVGGEEATFADPGMAGQRLSALLDNGPRRLLVLDDVWWPEQLAVLAAGSRHCARLVTTRVPGLLAGRSAAVLVDQMSTDQARRVLTAGLPPLDPAVLGELLAVTGRWPLILRLVNRILADTAQAGADVASAGRELLARLHTSGPAAVDDLSDGPIRGLDVAQPRERVRAVRATIQASTSLLRPQEGERFAELAVFVADDSIPFSLAARLWRVTGALDELRAVRLSARLRELAIVSPTSPTAGGLVLHDVVREFLRSELGPERLARLHNVLLDEVATDLAPALPLKQDEPPSVRAAWWNLSDDSQYMREHLIEHLLGAGRSAEAEALACDLRWAGKRLQESGPAAPTADLALVATPRAARLRAVLERSAHLLTPTQPARAVIDILHSRVASDPEWGTQVTELRETWGKPRLLNRWPLPDEPDPALRRVLRGHELGVDAVAIAPGGAWLATAGGDRTTRIWDTTTWRERATLACSDKVNLVAITADGSWLATATRRRVRIWDTTTWQERTTLPTPGGLISAVTVSSDGSWLAVIADRRVQTWDTATWEERSTLTVPSTTAGSVRIAPDGSWLASTGGGKVRIWDASTWQERWQERLPTADVVSLARVAAIAPDSSWLATVGAYHGIVRIWDATTGQERASLTIPSGRTSAVVISPDGNRLAAACRHGREVRIWDTATGNQQAVLTDHRLSNAVRPELTFLPGRLRLNAVAISPDGSWLVAGREDGIVQIWSATTGPQSAALPRSRYGPVKTIASTSDGNWLAVVGTNGKARLLEMSTGQQRSILTGHPHKVTAIAISPDGKWLATANDNGMAHFLDTATGQERAISIGRVTAVAISPDGTWLATTSYDRKARIWDTATCQLRVTLTGHGSRANTVAISHDGTWLATTSGYSRKVRTWDALTGRRRRSLVGPVFTWASAVAISSKGTWLATISEDGSVLTWDAATGHRRASIGNDRYRRVNAVAFSADEGWLATTSEDGTVRIWNAVTGQPGALMRVDGTLRACAWLGNDMLAVAGRNGLYVFDFLTAHSAPRATPAR